MQTLSATTPAAMREHESKYAMPPSPAHTEKDSRADSISGESDTSGLAYPVDELGTDGPKVYPLPPKSRVNSVLPEDVKTPDNWVERDGRLIRLTGIHPFNVEAPLSELYDEGFLTTKDLHYVRNHGAVPKVEDDEIYNWSFTVEGMVENPIEISVRELIKGGFEKVTYPVTLVCAGNRRKEQNIVRKTRGFSWGAAGLSTALWTGVAIGDLLRKAKPLRGAKYVCFTGADKLPNGYYETSIKLSWCLDANKGVLVSYKMNGEMLSPDHGKPVRIIIPGQIGGRSVKWLRKIIVTPEPSDNWYHIYDNRVLPTMITPAASDSLPETWKDERYAIYDLNANSATCYPAHNEKVPMSGGLHVYKVRGYGYGGGGRRITRVEVTLDKGKSWTLASIEYPEDEYRNAPDGDMLFGGKMDMSWRETCFCWCFWHLDIPIADLAQAQDVMVRCMDEGMMVQPRDLYWSVLGMMNNPWFRVVIHKEDGHLRFEHPTQPALIPGGWMERVKNEGGNITNGFWGEKVAGEEDTPEETAVQDICMTNPKVDRQIAIDELRKHDGEDEPWFVVNGEVYDGTPFLEGHPGGAASIFGAAGQDATEEFMTIRTSCPFPVPPLSPFPWP
jgi:nitrate reductase (NAD(P)H)